MRVPRYPVALAFLLGTGSQIYIIFYMFLASMTIGLINLYFRYTWVATFFVLIGGSGWVNGYITSICMKNFGISDMIRGSTLSAFIYPSMIFICCISVDLIETVERSSSAIPVISIMCYGVVFMTISVACCYHGAV